MRMRLTSRHLIVLWYSVSFDRKLKSPLCRDGVASNLLCSRESNPARRTRCSIREGRRPITQYTLLYTALYARKICIPSQAYHSRCIKSLWFYILLYGYTLPSFSWNSLNLWTKYLLYCASTINGFAYTNYRFYPRVNLFNITPALVCRHVHFKSSFNAPKVHISKGD